MDTFNQLKDLIASVEDDAVKFFEKGNAAAGTRVRKALQQAKTLAQDIRNDVTAKKNTK
ncbi:histone H1 [Parapedobacter defluvii]|uniref:Histone H1 n=1 Tax=Parapedobacter defluvii TaxID=2045106 RepID=A0ABQ1MM61_9SPHI|nr:histone H1 [Parapedobacter defluvii]GGC42693.1 histone H1 [Parapedobacter defluvii]